MFENSFSFDGRIRRTEFGLSIIIYSVLSVIISFIITGSNGDAAFLGLAYIPMFWFSLAQGAKRCHDLDNSGWWQIIPFYGLWLLFQDGQPGQNQYGTNPKGITSNTYNSAPNSSQQPSVNSGGYNAGQYNGGHNSSGETNSFSGQVNNRNFTNNSSQNSSGEYKSGEMYK